MTNGRTLTAFAECDPYAVELLAGLIESKTNVAAYRECMRLLGERLANGLAPFLEETEESICVICTVEDADFLARGLIERLEREYLKKVHLLCIWNERVGAHGLSMTPVRKSYIEDFNKQDAVFVVVKSIISGSCVVKTNLTKAITGTNPKKIFVAAPVMYSNAQENLEKEFPKRIVDRFHFVAFAIDSELNNDHTEVVPGIGGSVYELLGFASEQDKNKYMPTLVRNRRKKAFQLA